MHVPTHHPFRPNTPDGESTRTCGSSPTWPSHVFSLVVAAAYAFFMTCSKVMRAGTEGMPPRRESLLDQCTYYDNPEATKRELTVCFFTCCLCFWLIFLCQVRIQKANDLPAMERGTSSDPYVVIKVYIMQTCTRARMPCMRGGNRWEKSRNRSNRRRASSPKSSILNGMSPSGASLRMCMQMDAPASAQMG